MECPQVYTGKPWAMEDTWENLALGVEENHIYVSETFQKKQNHSFNLFGASAFEPLLSFSWILTPFQP